MKDEDGNPLKDVTVYVYAQCFDFQNLDEELRACRQLAKTESREDGGYEFRDLAIKILNKPDPTVIGAALELLAVRKDGKAAWRGAYMLVKNAAAAAGNPGAIAPGTSTLIDMVFRPTRPIAGRVFDEADKPIVGAEIRLINCRPTPRQFPAKAPDRESIDYSLGGKRHAAPDAVAVRKSDAEGRFEFDSIPVDMRAIFIVSHADFSMAWLGATNTEDDFLGKSSGGTSSFKRAR